MVTPSFFLILHLSCPQLVLNWSSFCGQFVGDFYLVTFSQNGQKTKTLMQQHLLHQRFYDLLLDAN